MYSIMANMNMAKTFNLGLIDQNTSLVHTSSRNAKGVEKNPAESLWQYTLFYVFDWINDTLESKGRL